MLGMTDRRRALARTAWRTLTTREAYRNPWMRVREDTVEMPDGRRSDMVNLPRAKDAAISIALGIHNSQKPGQRMNPR